MEVNFKVLDTSLQSIVTNETPLAAKFVSNKKLLVSPTNIAAKATTTSMKKAERLSQSKPKTTAKRGGATLPVTLAVKTRSNNSSSRQQRRQKSKASVSRKPKQTTSAAKSQVKVTAAPAMQEVAAKVQASNRIAAERAQQFREMKARSGSKSFIMVSETQKAPFSNSNRQIHVKKVTVDSFDHAATASKPQVKHSVSNQAKMVSQTKLALPQIEDLDAQSAEEVSTGASSHRLLQPEASFQKQAAQTSRGKFMTNYFDSDEDDDSPTSYRSQCKTYFAEKVRQRTTEPGKRKVQSYLAPFRQQDKIVEDILARSERVRQSSQATIERATLVTNREGHLIGSANKLEAQLCQFDEIVNQIQSKMELKKQ